METARGAGRQREPLARVSRGWLLWGHHSRAACPSLMFSHILFFITAGSQVPVADDDPGVMKASKKIGKHLSFLCFILEKAA